MSKIILQVGSVTTTTRLKKILEALENIRADVIHTPSQIAGKSCSYSLRIPEQSLDTALDISDKYEINIRGIYKELQSGKELQYYDIS